MDWQAAFLHDHPRTNQLCSVPQVCLRSTVSSADVLSSAHNDDENNSVYRDVTPGDTRVFIENGVLLSGIICKNTLGAKAGGVIHVITTEHGTEIARQFYGNVQTVVNNWLLLDGASIGVGDTLADEKTREKIQVTSLTSM